MVGERKNNTVSTGENDPGSKLKADEQTWSRRRRRHWYHKLASWAGEYWVELTIAAAVLLAIFLLVEPWDIREGLMVWARRTLDAFSGTVGVRLGAVARWFRSLTLSDATAVVILLGVTVLAAWRVRWRVMRMEHLWSTRCPECNSTSLQRRHRRIWDRIAGLVGFPVFRYRCRTCGWKGARIRRKIGPVKPAR